jgi:hypothetical protein
MSKTKTEVITMGGTGFQPGHPRFSGRKKKGVQAARELAAELNCEPLAFLMRVVNSDTIEQTFMEGGKKTRQTITIPLDVRIDCAKYVSRFLHPTLSATQVTGADEGPVQVVNADLTTLIMGDPAMVDAAQKLALLMARPDALPAPANGAPALGTPPARDPVSV